MQKLVSFLERNVQWIALGVGGLVLILIVYGYVFQTPVIVADAQKTAFKPGDIDAATLGPGGPYMRLKNQIANEQSPNFSYKDPVKQYVDALNAVAPAVVNTGPYATNPGYAVAPIDPNSGLGNYEKPLIPEIGAAISLDTHSGRSVVLLPVGGAVQPANQRQQPAATSRRDVDWASVVATVDMKALVKAFAKAHLKSIYETQIIYVELQRQEKIGTAANGDTVWGNPTVVDRWSNSQPLSNPIPPFPGSNATDSDLDEYWAAVRGNLANVLHPQFPEQDKNSPGDMWVLPGTPPEQPAKPVNNPRPWQGRGGPMQPPNNPWQGQLPFMQQPGPPGPMQANGTTDQAPGLPPLDAQGKFFPSDDLSNITLWAHDLTLKPEKVYRYRVRYGILNPLWRAPGSNASTRQFAVLSPVSDWSKPVTTPTRTQFFLVDANAQQRDRAANFARFVMFTWSMGKWNRSECKVLAGDTVGESDNSVVDVRRERVGPSGAAGDTYVLLADADGNVVSHTARDDMNLPKYKELNSLAPAGDTGAGASAGRQGIPPMDGGAPNFGQPPSGRP